MATTIIEEQANGRAQARSMQPQPPADGAGQQAHVRREWALVAMGLTALVAILALVVSVVALASNSKGTTIVPQAAAAAPAAASAAVPAKSVKLTIRADSKPGADGKKHDAFLPGTDLTAKPGQTLRFTIYNYDDMPHSFTSPKLAAGAAIPAGMRQMQGTPQDLTTMPAPGIGVDQNIPAGTDKAPSKTTFVIKVPKTAGSYVWYCKLPCDDFAMAHDGFMRGVLKVAA